MRLWKMWYRTGKTSRVSVVDDTMPPMTTVARGCCISAPVPVESAIGTKPNEATNAVINTGRNRVNAPIWIAWSSGSPSANNLLIKEIITIPFRVATPDRAINPTAADIERGIPLIHKKNNPPVKANGTPEKIRSAFFIDPNAVNRRKNIRSRAMGTTTQSLLLADIRFSNCPPHANQ